jgi:hypothetical protein
MHENAAPLTSIATHLKGLKFTPFPISNMRWVLECAGQSEHCC